MGDLEFQISLGEESSYLMKRCARKILESTFILRDKDEKLYRFISRKSNYQDLSAYFEVMGFRLIIDDQAGVCILIQDHGDEDTDGMEYDNMITLTMTQYHLLLVLWKVYLECLGLNEGTYITKGDLIDKIKYYDVLVSKSELNVAFKVFKKYSLIDFDDTDNGEEMKIELFPSLQIGWDLNQFMEIIEECFPEESDENDHSGSDCKITEIDNNEEDL